MFFLHVQIVICVLQFIINPIGVQTWCAGTQELSEHYVRRIHQARNKMDIDGFEQLLLELGTIKCAEKECVLVSYYISFIHFNLAVHYFNRSELQHSRAHLEQSLHYVDQSLERYSPADAFILKAHLLDFLVLFEPQRPTALLQNMWYYLEQAAGLEPQNPRLYLVKGLHYYFAPSCAGGDRQRAKACLRRAVRLFADDDQHNGISPQWGYEDALAWLGQIAVQEDSLDLAVYYYNQALSANNDFDWIKYELLPVAQEKLAMNKSLGNVVAQVLAISFFVLLLSSLLLWIIKIKCIKL